MDAKLISIQEEEEKTHSQEFWNNPKEAEKLLKGIKQKKNWTSSFLSLNSSYEDLSVLFDFFKAGDILNFGRQNEWIVVVQRSEPGNTYNARALLYLATEGSLVADN